MNFIPIENPTFESLKKLSVDKESPTFVNEYVASKFETIFGKGSVLAFSKICFGEEPSFLNFLTYCKCKENDKIYAVAFVNGEPLMWKEAIKKENTKYGIVFNISFDNEKKVIPKLKEMSFKFCDFPSFEGAKNMTLPLLKGLLAQNVTDYVSGTVEILYEKYDADEKSLSTEYVDSDTSGFSFTKKGNSPAVLNIDF